MVESRGSEWSKQWRIQDFPGGGGASTPKSAIIFQIFCQKPHGNERIWTPRVTRIPGSPLDPPMLRGSEGLGEQESRGGVA